MTKYSKQLSTLITILLFILLPTLVQAQGNPGGDPGVQIDGGATLIFAAVIGYGAKKLKDARDKKKEK